MAVLMVAWLASLAMWRLGRLDQRYAHATVLYDHAHGQSNGRQLAQRHLHLSE